ncbi:hypothetical protein HF526_19215 [Pseudonocardia sp. K10HN5]|uniref:Uncharacterized protein n=2 Tax=Pseudonocardia acidicola TaxID=2724939 RepID=A0ABX1SCY1_9PSEU|nr:hypothetical protein [Pseudonocardia acidicola]
MLLTGRVVGAALTVAMGWIHLQLWFDGFRDVRIIGVLFLLNAVGAAVLAVALLVVRFGRLAPVAALGALFTAGTLAALVVSLTVGLFGVREVIDAPLVPATLAVEAAGTVALALTAYAARHRG